jgi:xylulose-5-phosphate/fructose-6-phosphate phosphoketolase
MPNWRAANYLTLGQIYLLDNPRKDMGRFNLIADASARIAKMSAVAGYVRQEVGAKLVEHHQYITRHGEDLPEVRDWKWEL